MTIFVQDDKKTQTKLKVTRSDPKVPFEYAETNGSFEGRLEHKDVFMDTSSWQYKMPGNVKEVRQSKISEAFKKFDKVFGVCEQGAQVGGNVQPDPGADARAIGKCNKGNNWKKSKNAAYTCQINMGNCHASFELATCAVVHRNCDFRILIRAVSSLQRLCCVIGRKN